MIQLNDSSSLTLSLLLMTQEAFVDSVDQDQTVHIFILGYNLNVSSSCYGSVFLASEKIQLIYSVLKGLKAKVGLGARLH